VPSWRLPRPGRRGGQVAPTAARGTGRIRAPDLAQLPERPVYGKMNKARADDYANLRGVGIADALSFARDTILI